MLYKVIGGGMITPVAIAGMQFETDSGTGLDPAFTTGAATFQWKSPDGSISTGATPTPTLDQIGVYTVTCSDWSDVTELKIQWDELITLENLSFCTALTLLYCYGNALTALDVTLLTSLTTLNCYRNSLTVLDVSTFTSLASLSCSQNSLSILDVAALTSLATLYCDTNSISTLEVAALTVLTTFECHDNGMDETNVDKILADLVTAGANNGTLRIDGTNAAPSGAGAASKTTLQGRGWGVTTS